MKTHPHKLMSVLKMLTGLSSISALIFIGRKFLTSSFKKDIFRFVKLSIIMHEGYGGENG
jgi:hypothetical protein